MKVARSLFIMLGCLALIPALASAQSAIAGVVTDNTGGVLPGVTVEAASPVLIEKVRTAITDGQGRYTITDLRPGIYTVTFSLQGFNTLVRDALELPGDFTATVNGQLAVGSIQESVTVTGESPVVNIQSAARTEVITRQVLDALPTPRNTQSFGYLMQGVRLSKPDVGGAQQMEQVNMRVHGANELHTTMQIDGMLVSPAFNDGAIQNYLNQAHFTETAFTTASQSAEVSAGGIRLNMIPNDGGNTFSGSFYAGVTDGSWQSNNLSDELRAKGLTLPTGITNIHDVNPAFGGPILRDKLWFFSSMRWTSVDEQVVNAFMPDGSPAIVDQYVRTPLARLTYQASPRNKFSAFLDRPFKYKGREFTFGIEPSRASGRRNPSEANYHNFGAKWTSTVSSRMLVEAGFTEVAERLIIGYQPDFFGGTTLGWPRPANVPTCLATPCQRDLDTILAQTSPWYRDVSHSDIITRQRTVARAGVTGWVPDREHLTASVSYVTGTHNMKTGVQWSFGQDRNMAQSHADLQEQRYRLGVPEAVVVTNNPWASQEYVNADVGVYAHDTWTIDRLTVNGGVRYEYFNSEIREQWAQPGRFVAGRLYPEIPGLPIWHDVSPRFGVVYDLFGNAKTALKFGANKYMRPMFGSFAKRYNPLRGVATDVRDWFDCDLLPGASRCSGRVLPTNGDDIVQDNEIGPSNNRNFGIAPDRKPADGLQREYNVELNASVQHELLPRWSVTAAWYRRQYYHLEGQDNLLLDPQRDYIPFQVANPLGNGEVLTVFNLDPSKRGQVSLLDFNSDTNTHISNDFELSFNGRLPNGGVLFGGWNASRNEAVTCDSDNPNGFNEADRFFSIAFLRGGRFCDERKLDIPFRHDFKLASTYPLPYGLEASGTLVSFAGNETQVVWDVPISAFPNRQRTQQVNVRLTPPGTKYFKRWNQVDVAVKKLFNIGRYQFVAQADIYNLLNSSVVLTETQTFGSSLGFPNTILQARLLRLVGQVKF